MFRPNVLPDSGCIAIKQKRKGRCSKIRGIIDSHARLSQEINLTGPYLVAEDDAIARPGWQRSLTVEHGVTNLACQSYHCNGAVALLFANVSVHRHWAARWQKQPYNDIDCVLTNANAHKCGPRVFYHSRQHPRLGGIRGEGTATSVGGEMPLSPY